MGIIYFMNDIYDQIWSFYIRCEKEIVIYKGKNWRENVYANRMYACKNFQSVIKIIQHCLL